jgi:hypothetical protein
VKQTLAYLVALVFGFLAHPLLAAVYFVSASGNDINSGLATNAAWFTIARVNAQTLSAGDQVLFESGTTFSGSIRVAPPEAGSAAQPIVFSSYGGHPAIISPANDANGFLAVNCGGLIVSNLDFAGGGRTVNTGSGIEFFNTMAGSTLSFFRVDHVDVGGFGNTGVYVYGLGPTTWFNDVRVTHANVHDVGIAGIETYAKSFPAANVISNVYIGFCTVSNITGVSSMKSTHTGDGILIAQANNALVEYCEAVSNCWNGYGAVGIWTWASTNVTIQFCESHHNGTLGSDGDGFDLDGGSTGCVMQYNYSHDNAGAGYGIFQFSGATLYLNNVVRYNISQNDGRNNSYGAISIWNGSTDPGITNVDIYNNTLFVSPASTGTPSGIYFFGDIVNNIQIRNNCIITSGGLNLVNSTLPTGLAATVLFQGNDYWSSGAVFSIYWNNSHSYSSLVGWRGAGMETVGTTNVGLNLDPQLVSAGGGGTIGDATLLPTLTAYQSNPGSPLREAGLDLNALFGFNIGAQDFYGNPVPNGLPDIGAYDGVACTIPVATISASGMVGAGSIVNIASVPNAGAGATYNWSVINGVITSGAGTNVINYTAGALGEVTLGVVVNTPNACSGSSSSTNVSICTQAPQLESPFLTTNGTFSIMVTGSSVSSILQASTNLVNWANVCTGTPPCLFIDSQASNYPARLYRALLGP